MYSSSKRPSIVDITRILVEDGLTQKPSKSEEIRDVNNKIVGDILRRPFYCGFLDTDNKKKSPHKYRHLISQELFDKCQEIRKENSLRKKKADDKNKLFIYSNLISCFHCNRTYSLDEKHKKTKNKVTTYYYLRTTKHGRNFYSSKNNSICKNCSPIEVYAKYNDLSKLTQADRDKLALASNVTQNLIDYQVYKILSSMKIPSLCRTGQLLEIS